MGEGQAARVRDVAAKGRFLNKRLDGHRGLAGHQRQRDQLQVLVRLACAGHLARVVEAQAVVFRQARPQGREVRQAERGLLRLKLARDDQQVMVDHVELVQQAHVRRRGVRDVQGRVVGQEGIGTIAGLAAGRAPHGCLRARLFTTRTRKRMPPSSTRSYEVGMGTSAPQRRACSVVRSTACHKVPLGNITNPRSRASQWCASTGGRERR